MINLKKLLMLVLFYMLWFSSVEADIITLEKDTELHPQGWLGGALTFKGGTEASLQALGAGAWCQA